MKKTLYLILIIAMCFSLCACRNTNSQTVDPSTANSQIADPSTASSQTTAPSASASQTTAPSASASQTTVPSTSASQTTDSSTDPSQSATNPTEQPTKAPTTAPTEAPATCSHSYKDATCTIPKTCTKCGVTEGSAMGHTWKDATCIEPKTCSICKTIDGSAKGHTPVTDPAVAATCVIVGKTEGSHCSVCNSVLTAQREIAAIGHAYSKTVKEPTCTEEGYTTYTCSCGDTYSEKIDCSPHDYNKGRCTKCNTIIGQYRADEPVLLDEYAGVKFYYVGTDFNGSFYSILIRIENTNNNFLTIQAREDRVNGKSIGETSPLLFSATIGPNKTATEDMTVWVSGFTPSLADFGEEFLEYLEFNFYISPEDEWNPRTSPTKVILYPYA